MFLKKNLYITITLQVQLFDKCNSHLKFMNVNFGPQECDETYFLYKETVKTMWIMMFSFISAYKSTINNHM